MKKLQFIVVSLLLLGTVIAEPPDEVTVVDYDFDQVEEAYTISLGYENIGVVESALFCIVKLHQRFPARSFNQICEVVNELSKTSHTPLIRYKASITCMYLNNPTLMAQLKEETLEDGPEFWAMLVKNIQSQPHKTLFD